MNLRWARWRIFYTLSSPYLRPDRLLAASTGHLKPPDFLIIGTERGGTTSLYSYLTETPGIVVALRKEVHFFDQHYVRGWTWYLSHFPTRKSGTLTGEASPHYYFFPEAAQRVAVDLPKVKLILLLRNPIDRAYSHYQHEVAMGYEKLSFEDALKREGASDGDISALRNLRDRGTFEYVHFSYLAKGLYINHLKCWLDRILRQRMFIAKSESFFRDPRSVFSQVLEFLGLPPSNRTTFRKYNEGIYPPMSDETRVRLRKFYAPYNERLSAFLDMDLREWT